MKMNEIKELALKLALKPGRMTKMALIQAIQEKEGNFSCFGSANDGFCDQTGCAWRSDCLPLRKQ